MLNPNGRYPLASLVVRRVVLRRFACRWRKRRVFTNPRHVVNVSWICGNRTKRRVARQNKSLTTRRTTRRTTCPYSVSTEADFSYDKQYFENIFRKSSFPTSLEFEILAEAPWWKCPRTRDLVVMPLGVTTKSGPYANFFDATYSRRSWWPFFCSSPIFQATYCKQCWWAFLLITNFLRNLLAA